MRNQYADIESDSTHELTTIEFGKAEVRNTVFAVRGNETVCVGTDESGKGESWGVNERDTIRAQTDIEVKVVQK